jgi:sphinganine-1-phosphate aldolase
MFLSFEWTGGTLLCGLLLIPMMFLCGTTSPVVLVRTLRPYIKVAGVVGWLGYRLCGGSESLWGQLVEFLNAIERQCVSPVSWFWPFVPDILAMLLLSSVARTFYCVVHCSTGEWKDWVVSALFDWAKEHVGPVKKEMDKEMQKVKDDIVKDAKSPRNNVILRALPKKGRLPKSVMKEICLSGKVDNAKWEEGLVSGTVYANSSAHTELMNAAYGAYSWSNPLHHGIWPSLNQYECEIIAMTSSMLNGGNTEIRGATTSGGTESIILAIKAHREHYGIRRYIQHPELICGPTAHAAVDKACELMGIRKVVVKDDEEDFVLNPQSVDRLITSNTILIYASAPNYPQGVIDPVEELSKIALKYDIGLHVDACLGGFVLPFAKQLGYDIPSFDFTNAGVTSMSVDTHKYAYASKGTSVVLYRDEELRRAQYFPYANWTGGLYSTPTIAGSRPGALLACAWAALVSIGEEGYQERVRLILQASQQIADGIENMKDVYVLGKQKPTMIVCFSSDTLDIYRIADMMEKHGWSLNALQHPASIHICVTLNTVDHVDKFLSDLEESALKTRKEGAVGKTKGTAAIYGTTNSLPAGPVKDLLRVFTDMTLVQ